MIKAWMADRIEWLDDNILNGNVFNPSDHRNEQKYPLRQENDIVYFLSNYSLLRVEISTKMTNQVKRNLDLGWRCHGIHRLDLSEFNLEPGKYRVDLIDDQNISQVQIDILIK